MNKTNEELTHLSTLFERLAAVVHDIEHCEIMLPEHIAQLEQDKAGIYNMMDRVELWATGEPSFKRF